MCAQCFRLLSLFSALSLLLYLFINFHLETPRLFVPHLGFHLCHNHHSSLWYNHCLCFHFITTTFSPLWLCVYKTDVALFCKLIRCSSLSKTPALLITLCTFTNFLCSSSILA
ncbi:unnamed protein product [Calicophoron daubneyi]|uniref:Secreted protein n=1 Tax=Calicophoron daubneyi TaxID=300641 RepID=A0AAV2TNF3_CALDB